MRVKSPVLDFWCFCHILDPGFIRTFSSRSSEAKHLVLDLFFFVCCRTVCGNRAVGSSCASEFKHPVPDCWVSLKHVIKCINYILFPRQFVGTGTFRYWTVGDLGLDYLETFSSRMLETKKIIGSESFFFYIYIYSV